MHNMDKLFERVAERGHVCVGLDTSIEYIPEKERRRAPSDAEAVLAYNKAIINATADIAACFKIQIAFYEELGLKGMHAFADTLKYLRGKGALAITDCKRNDIADTAARYARAHFDGDFETDFVTLNPYLGMDSIEPWFHWAREKGKGAFILMRTSNKGRRDFECLELKGGSPPLAPAAKASSAAPPPGGSAPKPPRRLYDEVGDKVSELAALCPGKHGYGAFGIVVGADPHTEEERKEAISIREERTNLFFLIPGYGAQGGAASDAALLLREGNGGVVNASRSILKAWQEGDGKIDADIEFAATAARQAALKMRDAILLAAGRPIPAA